MIQPLLFFDYMKNYIFFFIGLFLFTSSCTSVTSTNLPGKKAASFPKKMIGEFEFVYPEDFAALFGDEDAKTYVTLTKNAMTIKNAEGETTTNLGDSLYVTSIGKSLYLSMGEEPNFTVFKVAYSGKDILLYPLFAGEETSLQELEPYFSSVTETPSYLDEDTGEAGPPSYSVTIDDKKLDSYFKSTIPIKDPFRLKRVDGKK